MGAVVRDGFELREDFVDDLALDLSGGRFHRLKRGLDVRLGQNQTGKAMFHGFEHVVRHHRNMVLVEITVDRTPEIGEQAGLPLIEPLDSGIRNDIDRCPQTDDLGFSEEHLRGIHGTLLKHFPDTLFTPGREIDRKGDLLRGASPGEEDMSLKTILCILE